MNFSKHKINLSGRAKYYLAYTICFAVTALVVYFWFLKAHRTLIWRVDGWEQHYKALVYYSKYLRSIIKNLLLYHKLVIPNWDFAIGQGGDILSSLHYYTIGDPFSIFSIFFSEESMYLYYDAAVILRMLFAGIAFSELCFETGRKSRYAVLAGAMAYAFCGWAIYAKLHPFFLNPLLFLPLLILGIEKIIKKKRPYLFIISVALSAISNFYFFYMLVLTVIIYVITRTVLLYRKNIKEGALLIGRIAIFSISGVILSAVTSLPLIYVFLNDARVSGGTSFHFFYPLSYYSSLPQFFVSSGYQHHLSLSFSIPILLAVFLMYYKRKQYQLTKSLFVTCVIITLFPIFAQTFNGFTYAANRWAWAFALLCAYILTLLWPDLMNLNAKEGRFIFKCTALYFIICMLFEHSQNKKAFASIALAFILLFILLPLSDKGAAPGYSYKRKQQLALIILSASTVINSHWGNSFFDSGVATIYMEVKQLVLHDNETAAVSAAADLQGVDEFYRYSGRTLTKNANIIAGISSTESYWSLTNPKLEDYRDALNIWENRSHDPSNYDDRAGLTTLASVLYYVVPQSDPAPAPYGFTYVDNPEAGSAYKVYRNEYALPLAYTYGSYVKEEAWAAFSPVAKEEAMLQSAVLSEEPVYAPEKEPKLDSYEVPYTINCNSDEITIKGNTIVTTAENASATISFDALPNSEVFICFENLQFKETPKYDLYYGDDALDPLDLYNEIKWDSLDYASQLEIKKDKIYWSGFEHSKANITVSTANSESKTLNYATKDNDFYGGRHYFAGCLSSTEEGISSMDISFFLRGVYSFDSLKIICQPMDNYVNQIEALKETTLQNMNIGTDTVTGDITLDTPDILCFSIPYSIGWSAYVDGKAAKVYQANVYSLALDLDAGAHEIKLVYRTPFLREGCCISLFAAVIFIAYIILNERKKN